MLMVVKCNLLLYADDTCLVFQSKNVKDIEKQLNEDFANMRVAFWQQGYFGNCPGNQCFKSEKENI